MVVGYINCWFVGFVCCVFIGFVGVLLNGVWVGNFVCVLIVVLFVLVECMVSCSGFLCLFVFGGSFGVCVFNFMVLKVFVVILVEWCLYVLY